MDIDVEGGELDVLKGFDINKFMPKLFVIENVAHIGGNDNLCKDYLIKFGYKLDKCIEVNEFYIKG